MGHQLLMGPMTPRNAVALGLLTTVPVSIAAERLQWGDTAVFLTAVASIIPLAVWLSTATEELSIALGLSLIHI